MLSPDSRPLTTASYTTGVHSLLETISVPQGRIQEGARGPSPPPLQEKAPFFGLKHSFFLLKNAFLNGWVCPVEGLNWGPNVSLNGNSASLGPKFDGSCANNGTKTKIGTFGLWKAPHSRKSKWPYHHLICIN